MNLQDFENQGWTQMQQLLDREMPTQMPEKRKKRFFVWWKWAGLALCSLFALGFACKMFFIKNQNSTPNNNKVNKKIDTTKSVLPFASNSQIITKDIAQKNDNQIFIKKSVAKQGITEGGIGSLNNNLGVTQKQVATNFGTNTEGGVSLSENNVGATQKEIETKDNELLKNNEPSKEKNKIAENIDFQLVSLLPLISKEIKMEKSELNINFASPLQPLKTPQKTLSTTKWTVFAASNAALSSPLNWAVGVQYRLPLRAKKWDFWAGVSCWATTKTTENWVYLHPTAVDLAVQPSTTPSVLPLLPLEELQLTHLFYVNMPFNAQYNFSNTFFRKMYIDLNFNTSYLFSQRLENKETGFAKYALNGNGGTSQQADPLGRALSSNSQVLPPSFAAQDLGLNTWDFSAGVGVGYRLGANWFASIQYQQGLNNILTASFVSHYNHFWQLKLKKEF